MDSFISEGYNSLIGTVYAISSEKGLMNILVNPESLPDIKRGDPFCAANQLRQYFNDGRKTFDIPFDFTATEFTIKVLKEISKIPYGKTATYKQIASALGDKNAARAVGGALNRNPIPIIIPCHRVLAKSSLGGYAFGTDIKIKLLNIEGALL